MKKDMICKTVATHDWIYNFVCKYPVLEIVNFLFFPFRPSSPDDSSTKYKEQSIYTDYDYDFERVVDDDYYGVEYENTPFRLHPDTKGKGFILRLQYSWQVNAPKARWLEVHF